MTRLLGHVRSATPWLFGVVVVTALMLAASSLVDAHVGQPSRHWAAHASGRFDYFIPFCFEDGWPNGSQGTSANNVSFGMTKWNDKFPGGQEIDFRYSRMIDCDDRNDEDVVVRYQDLVNGRVGQFSWTEFLDMDGNGHLKSGSIMIDNNTGNAHVIFYGGCCPAWQGAADDRIHVQQIAGHEAGHAAILPADFNNDQTCCEADLGPDNVNWHSSHAGDLMFGLVDPGENHLPTPREITWLDQSYPTVD